MKGGDNRPMRQLKKFAPLGLAALGVFVMTRASLAVGAGEWGDTFGFTSTDLQAALITAIQWILGLLGLVAVIMIIYGGFMWMTAGGNDDRVGSAKKILSAAVIGLIIVLLSWAIISFAINVFSNTTNPQF